MRPSCHRETTAVRSRWQRRFLGQGRPGPPGGRSFGHTAQAGTVLAHERVEASRARVHPRVVLLARRTLHWASRRRASATKPEGDGKSAEEGAAESGGHA